MASRLYSLLGKSKSLLIPVFIVTALIISSCTKTTNADDAKKFVGTWNGVINCTGVVSGSNNLVINAGSDGVTATIPVTAGIGSCLANRKITGTAYEDVLTFPQQQVTDACGNVYTVTGRASITNDSLSFTINAVGDSTGACNFRGKK